MPTYEVTLPIIRGFEVFTVEADSDDEAVQEVLEGNFTESEYVRVETDYDSNLAGVERIDG